MVKNMKVSNKIIDNYQLDFFEIDEISNNSTSIITNFPNKKIKNSTVLPLIFLMTVSSIAIYSLDKEELVNTTSHKIEYNMDATLDYRNVGDFKKFVTMIVSDSKELEPEFAQYIKNNIENLLW